MPFIYHITAATSWDAAQKAGEYRLSTRGKGLDDEGFIHCAYAHQVTRVDDRVFAGVRGLVLLVIDEGRGDAEIWDENLEGSGELFPHIYGPLKVDAVIDVLAFEPLSDGTFQLPDGIALGP